MRRLPCYLWCLVVMVSMVVAFYISLEILRRPFERNLPWWHWDSPRDTVTRESAGTWKGHSTEVQKQTTSVNGQAITPTKVILFNHPPFGLETPYSLDRDFCGGECLVTYDTSYRSVADAIIYHCAEMTPERIVVTRSRSRQLFVFYCMESPSTTRYIGPGSFSAFGDVFNLTMTYRRDSDLYSPYATLSEVTNFVKWKGRDLNEFVKSKTKHTLWIVSNCNATKGSLHRMTVVQKMVAAGLKIDLRGSCFDRVDRLNGSRTLEVVSQYKFYLSFENAFHCKDYITEKTWSNALKGGAIPVIWGPRKDDVQAVLPSDSYIMVEDFPTPTDLVNYLIHLDQDDEEYKSYFKWWFEAPPTPKPTCLCALCQYLHTGVDDDSNSEKVSRSVEDWWFNLETKTCLAARTDAEVFNFNISYFYLLFANLLFWLTSTAVGVCLIIVISSQYYRPFRRSSCLHEY